MPSYMPQFRCKCGDCRAVCCRGWRINLTKTEYLRLTALPCSAALRARMEKSLCVFDAPTDDAFAYIRHGADGRCPMLDADGLCFLQKECGDGTQPAVCRLYPRAVRALDGERAEIVAATSCEATVEMLMRQEMFAVVQMTGEIASDIPPHEVEHAEEAALRQTCLSLLQTPGRALESCFSDIASALGVSYAMMPGTDADTGALLHARALLLAFGREGNSISALAEEALESFSLREGVSEESLARFRAARLRFYERFPRANPWLENLLANHFFFMQFPPRDLSHTEAFTALCGAFTLLFVLTVSHCDKNPTKEAFADAAAAVFRRVEHSNFYEIAPHLPVLRT